MQKDKETGNTLQCYNNNNNKYLGKDGRPMKELIELLNKIGTFYLATTDGDQPHVRPLGFVMDYEGQLAFCTGNFKDMYRQMVANPKIEISGYDGEYILRLTGTAKFITTEDAQKKAIETMPILGTMYAAGDGKFEIFALENGTATCSTMSGESKQLTI